MKLVEVKSRVDFRLKPLLVKGVRVLYRKQEFEITEYDYFDSEGTYSIFVSDRTDPLIFTPEEIKTFINEIKRKDHVPIPAFDFDASAPVPGKKHHNTVTKKKTVTVTIDDDEEEEEEDLPEEIAEEEVQAPAAITPSNSGKFVHIESTIKQYVTKNYQLFSVLQGNRSLNRSKIKRIKEEINAGTNLLKYCPIIVMERGDKLEVVDGQHRLAVAKEIGSYIWYVIIADPITLYEIAKMNSNTEKWKSADYINCYAQAGNEHYVKIKEFVNTYSFPMSVTLQMLRNGVNVKNSGARENVVQLFQTGKYTVRKEAEAIALAEQVLRFKSFPGHRTAAFISAISRIIINKQITLDEVVEAYEKHSEDMMLQSNDKNYLANLEVIVNKGKSKRRIIF